MKKKWSLWLLSLSVALTPMVVVPTMATDANVKLEYTASQTGKMTNTMGGKIKLTNTGKQAVDLENLTLRYYYTKDQNLAQSMWCDHAGLINGGNYQTVTSDVVGNFVSMSAPTDTADTYIEIGFKAGAPTLLPNGTVEIQVRITNANWVNYDQSNDYSFQGTQYITMYHNGVLFSGQEPGSEGVIDSEVQVVNMTFDKNSEVVSKCSTPIVFNGNVLEAVKKEGATLEASAYNLSSEDILTLSENYLNTLPIGEHDFVLDFSAGKDAVIKVNVIDTTDYDFAITLSPVSVRAGETIAVPLVIRNVPEGINAADFVLAYNPSIFEVVDLGAGEVVPSANENFTSRLQQEQGTIHVLFVDELQQGKDMITQNGQLMVVTLKAKQAFSGQALTVRASSFSNYALEEMPIGFKY